MASMQSDLSEMSPRKMEAAKNNARVDLEMVSNNSKKSSEIDDKISVGSDSTKSGHGKSKS